MALNLYGYVIYWCQLIFLLMEKPQLFQISINAQKFTQFTSTLNHIIANHQQLLQTHTRQLAQIRLSIDQRITRIKGQLQYQVDKMDKRRKEQSKNNMELFGELNKKYQGMDQQHESKTSLYRRELQQMRSLFQILTRSNKDNRDQILKQVQNSMANQRTLIAQEVVGINQRVENIENQVNNSLAANNYLLKNILQANQNQNPKKRQHRSSKARFSTRKHQTIQQSRHDTRQQRQSRRGTRNDSIRNTKKSNQSQQYDHQDRQQQFQEMMMREVRDRKKKKMQQKCLQQNLQYASISAKVQSLQSRLIARQNQSLNKVVYPTAKRQIQARNSQFSQSFAHLQLQRKNLQTNITTKLQNIQNIVKQTYNKIRLQMNGMTQIQQQNSQHISFLTVRCDKDRTKITQALNQIKRLQQKKMDDKLIDNLVTMIRKTQHGMQQSMQKKLQRQVFQLQKQRMGQKVQIMSQTLGDKADKQQIKRAFMFIEDKIKQLVMIVAEDTQNQKEGAIRRIPFKCLSCDKDIDCGVTVRIGEEKKENKIGSRGSTSQLRRRIRVGIEKGEQHK